MDDQSKKNFVDEYKALLEKHGVEFDYDFDDSAELLYIHFCSKDDPGDVVLDIYSDWRFH
jgi:hypothetical protein